MAGSALSQSRCQRRSAKGALRPSCRSPPGQVIRAIGPFGPTDKVTLCPARSSLITAASVAGWAWNQTRAVQVTGPAARFGALGISA